VQILWDGKTPLGDGPSGTFSEQLTVPADAAISQHTVVASCRTHVDVTDSQSFASGHHPSVDLYLDGKAIATVEIEVKVALTIAGMIAVVRQGRLTEIQSGSCTASGSLAVQGLDIVKSQRKFDLYGVFGLGQGVPLLEPAPTHGHA
jgi:hypothetical protein